MMCNTRKDFLKLVVFLCVVLFTCGQDSYLPCGRQKVNIVHLIHNGSNATAGHWPWHAAVYHRNEYVCGGSIIDQNTILTASHCVHRSGFVIPTTYVSVHVGRSHLNVTTEHTQVHHAKELIVHPEFHQNSINHDIALIKLSSNITMTNYVQPVCLWTMDSKQNLIEGKNGTVVGFGLSEQDVVSGQLKQAPVEVLDPFDCIQMDRDVYGRHLTWETFCGLGQEGVSACNGDSGGGLFFEFRGKWFVRGFVSYSPGRDANSNLCDPLKPTVFTDVAKYLNWIKPHINQRVLSNESDLFGIYDAEKLRLLNSKPCGVKSSILLEFGEIWSLPWIGFVSASDDNNFRCTVTLISEWYAVGLASCFRNVDDEWFIIFGGYREVLNDTCYERDRVTRCSYPTQKREMENVTKHPKFNRYNKTHNIALVELMTPVDTTQPNVMAICISATTLHRTNATTNLHVALNYEGNSIKNIPVRYVESSECIQRLTQGNVTHNLDNHRFCVETANAEGLETCSSNKPGSPLQEMKLSNRTERYFLRGLDLSGLTCEAEQPTVYLNIEPYLDWILYNMRYHTIEAMNVSRNSTAYLTLESEWYMLQQQPGKEKLRLFNMDTCGVTSAAIQHYDQVPWIGILSTSGPYTRSTTIAVLITEWYALALKRDVYGDTVWRYFALKHQLLEIKSIIMPSTKHPRQMFSLIELLEPANLKNPLIKPICLPFMEKFHKLNSTTFVMSYANPDYIIQTFDYISENLAMLDHQICQQKLLSNDLPLLDGKSSCATNPYRFSYQDLNIRLGSPFQMHVKFGDNLRYFLYGMNVEQEYQTINSKHGLYLFNKIELADLDWIVENMQEKERQTTFPFIKKNETFNLEPLNVSIVKRNLFNFDTCGESSRSHPTPWIGVFLCYRIHDVLYLTSNRFPVTLISERYAIGPAQKPPRCNEENMNYQVLFGCYSFPPFWMQEDVMEYLKRRCEDDVQLIAVQKTYVHPQYNEFTHAHDIALFQLASPVNTSLPSVKLICLPNFDEFRSYGTSSLAIVSSRIVGVYRDMTSNEVTNADKKIMDMAECQKRWKGLNANVTIDSSHHCVLNKLTSEDYCYNSRFGSTLVSRQKQGPSEINFLRGFIVQEEKHCSFYIPELFTNTDVFLDWILETVEASA